MADLNKIIVELSKLTVVEAADLSKKLEEKWGVTAAAPVAAAPAATGAAQAEEKSDFTIFLADRFIWRNRSTNCNPTVFSNFTCNKTNTRNI